MSSYVEALRLQDKELIGSPAQPLINVSGLMQLLDSRGLECPISGDHTTLYAATEARSWIYDC